MENIKVVSKNDYYDKVSKKILDLFLGFIIAVVMTIIYQLIFKKYNMEYIFFILYCLISWASFKINRKFIGIGLIGSLIIGLCILIGILLTFFSGIQ